MKNLKYYELYSIYYYYFTTILPNYYYYFTTTLLLLLLQTTNKQTNPQNNKVLTYIHVQVEVFKVLHRILTSRYL